MARIVLTDVSVVFGASDDLSDHIASVTLSSSYDVLETTAFAGGNPGGYGTGAAKSRIAGLVDNSVTFEFHQDYAASEVDAILSAALGGTLLCKVKPTTATESATNPEYEFTCLISEYAPLSGAVGELATVSVTWPIVGAITKNVAP
jgi:hypothetical protein